MKSSFEWHRILAIIAVSVVSLVGFNAEAKPPGPTIVDTALAVNEESGEFSTLISALVTADLVETLDGNGQFTVFAPTDAAFLELGLDADSVMDVPVDTLSDILLYHVARGRRLAGDVLDSDQIRMLNRSFTYPSLVEEVPFINDSEILAPNVEASNGVIHVIGSVLDPTSAPSIGYVPEPSTLVLTGLVCLGTACVRRKRP